MKQNCCFHKMEKKQIERNTFVFVTMLNEVNQIQKSNIKYITVLVKSLLYIDCI